MDCSILRIQSALNLLRENHNNMNNEQKGFPLILVIIAIIVGGGLLREFDFETFRFRKVGLGIVYLITFVATVAVIIRGRIVKK